jgi:hypothetical protein
MSEIKPYDHIIIESGSKLITCISADWNFRTGGKVISVDIPVAISPIVPYNIIIDDGPS